MAPNIIDSLLDTDLYKLTMMQCVWHHYPKVNAKYKLYCRSQQNLGLFQQRIEEQVQAMAKLRFTDSELVYLSKFSYFTSDFVLFLKNFNLSKEHIHCESIDGKLELHIEGPWVQTILWEVPLLAIISELNSMSKSSSEEWNIGDHKLSQKLDFLNLQTQAKGLKIAEFGTRRRHSLQWHKHMLGRFVTEAPCFLLGTSNLLLAKEFQLTPIGTMAHEYLQAMQVLAPDLLTHQRFGLELWLREFKGELGIALSDVISMGSFLRDFNAQLSRAYQGIRQDSGDPLVWAQKALNHYEAHSIDCKEKRFVFSDGLTVEKAVSLYLELKDSCIPMFGIGTNLSNDLEYKALDIVIKLISINDQEVIKISDSPGKAVYQTLERLTKLKVLFNI